MTSAVSNKRARDPGLKPQGRGPDARPPW